MGKKSRRDRPGPAANETLQPAARGQLPLVCGFDPTPMGTSTRPSMMKIGDHEVLVPADIPPWKTYEQALSKLEKCFKECRFAVRDNPEELCELVRKQLGQKGYKVHNVTAAVPTGPWGNHSVYPAVASDINEASSKKPKDVYIMVRTPFNTPAFLGGTLYGLSANMGSIAMATMVVGSRATPAATIVCNKQHMILPTVAVQGSLDIAVRAICAMVQQDTESFTCVVCEETLLRVQENGEVELDRFLGADCGHVFHAECLMQHFKADGRGCPACAAPLPVEWNTKARQAAGNCVRIKDVLDESDVKDNADVLNALADEVRACAVADGIEGVPEAPTPLS